MAKSKLDWFKLDCQMDDKLELIESEFGLVGFAVVVKLWQKIYGGEGYYCEWNDDVALVFARKINAGANVVSEIVARCLTRGIFDLGMYKKSGILTSHGIQSRYYECAARRKGEKIKPGYLLLCNTQKSEDADNSGKNVYISKKNADISDTDKKRVEENRVDKKREDKNSGRPKRKASEPGKICLSSSEVNELISLSSKEAVDHYIRNLKRWELQNNKKCNDPGYTIRKWIAEDKKKQRSDSSGASYDLDEFEEFAKDFDLSRSGGKSNE